MPPRIDLSVVTHNIGDAELRRVPAPDIVEVHAQSGWADVYILQETDGPACAAQLATLISEASGSPCHASHSSRMNIAIVSRYPIGSGEELVADSSRYGSGAYAVPVQHPLGTIRVVSVHLDPIPKNRDHAGFVGTSSMIAQLVGEILLPTTRSAMAKEIMSWVANHRWPNVIIGGDFNTVPYSTAIRRMNRHYTDTLRGTRDYLRGTYWKVSGGPLPRVDFIFHSDEFQTINSRVIQIKAGDHYPVRAELVLIPPAK